MGGGTDVEDEEGVRVPGAGELAAEGPDVREEEGIDVGDGPVEEGGGEGLGRGFGAVGYGKMVWKVDISWSIFLSVQSLVKFYLSGRRRSANVSASSALIYG